MHTEIPKPALTLNHNYSKIYKGEPIRLRCDVQSGNKSDWEYKWFQDGDLHNPVFSSNETEYIATPYSKKIDAELLVLGKKTGNFSCMAVRKSDRKQSQVSDTIQLTIHGEFIIALLLSA